MLTSARLCKNHFVHGRSGEASHRVESVELELDRNKFLSFRSMSDDLDTYHLLPQNEARHQVTEEVPA